MGCRADGDEDGAKVYDLCVQLGLDRLDRVVRDRVVRDRVVAAQG